MFSGNIFYLGLVSFFTDVSSEMIYPILPIFLTSVLKASLSFVGLIEGIAESASCILKLVFGYISDKQDKRKPFVVFGYSISSLFRPLMAFAINPLQILFIRFADRLGKGIRTSPRDSLIAMTCNENEKGRAFGFQRAMDHAGAVTGTLIAFLLLKFITENFRTVFLLAYIPAIVAILIVVFLVKETKAKEICEKIERPKLDFRIFSSNFKKYISIIFLFTLGNSSDAFLLLRAKDIGITTANIPLLWLLLHISKSLFSTHGGALSDKIGRKKSIISGWILYSAVYLGFGIAKTPLHICLLFFIYGLFFALTESSEKAFVADTVEKEKLGSAYGIYNFAIGVGALPASLIMGIIWQKAGVLPAFLFGSFLSLISAVFLLLYVKEKKV